MISLNEPFWRMYFTILAIVLGSVFGSFLNCMAWRIPKKEKIFGGGDHCMFCGHRLKPINLIPIVSWVIQGGKCRYCKRKITPKYLLTEMFLAGMFVWTTLSCGLTILTVRNLIFISILFFLSLVDLNFYYIPDMCHVISVILYLATVFFISETPLKTLGLGILAGILIGGGILMISLVMDKLLKKESLGGGDVKLLFVCGLYLGFIKTLFGLVIACVLGILFIYGGKVIADHKDKKKAKMIETHKTDEIDVEETDWKRIPFGPAISLAMACMLLAGDRILSWYMSLL